MNKIILVSLAVGIFVLFLFYMHANSEATLKKAIMNFAEDEPSAISFGEFSVVDSQSVETVLSFKDKAIPDLVNALSEANPLIVGQSAYCLERLRAKQGLTNAQEAIVRLEAISGPRTRSEAYAIIRLQVYLRSANENFQHEEPL